MGLQPRPEYWEVGATMNPYNRLKEIAQEWMRKVQHPHTVLMWRYPKSKLGDSWTLRDLWDRTAAAEQLGYDVKVVAKEDGLCVYYVKHLPSIPWELQ
jgi:hypothetical protein